MKFSDTFALDTAPADASAAAVVRGNLRITVLTEQLIRVESGCFTDLPTQTVLCRRLDTPIFRITEKGENLLISTKQAALCIRRTDGNFVYAKTRDCGKVTSLSGNLKGTCRTLDMTAGFALLGDGILSKNGAALLDDSKSLLLTADGKIISRANGTDCYYFLYGRNYRTALRDFYRLCGATPLLPRFCLGNWWSRYYAYSQQEYLDLMARFQKEQVPFTVATVDMDWHWVKVTEKFGKEAALRHVKRAEGEKQRFQSAGWTGYSWNTDLFPDYKAFLNQLHESGCKVTLNLHPAAGVQFFEDQYPPMARAMGIDPATKEHVPFDITDPKFVENYFELLLHPYENDGVDFWWIDWQQGKKSKVPGLDPLWGLNHYHFLDSQKSGKRGLLLSRFAGAGSHRYPLGFSGDTVMCFPSLKFQPYFTATASNIGYGWWSHDIGGHHLGIHDDELYIRWLQFGVFSPINRLHATSDPFMGKEPWNYRPETEELAKQWLRLRKRLIPCLYTANLHAHRDALPLLQPMYYEHPWDERAYQVKNQYLFASQLVVAPLTERTDKHTGLSCTEVYLDGKRYTDIFTGDTYSYHGIERMYRNLKSIPVLAKEGTILPLDRNDTANGTDNPRELELLIFSGDGAYTLYEDDGESMQYQNGGFTTRRFTVKETAEQLLFTIEPAGGAVELVPEQREFRLTFRNVCAGADFTVSGTDSYSVVTKADCLTIDCSAVSSEQNITVCIQNPRWFVPRSRREKRTALLSAIPGNNILKTLRYSAVLKTAAPSPLLPAAVQGALREIGLQWEKNA